METTISSSTASKIKYTQTRSNKKLLEMLEFNRFGVIAFVLAIVACASGITAGLFVNGSSQLDLTLVALPTMLTLCSILIVAPIRWIIGIGTAAFLIDLMIIIF